MKIKKLSNADVDMFKAIRLEALRNEPENYASHARDWEDLSPQDWLLRMSDCTVFVALKEGVPVGIMALMPNRPSKMAHRATLIMVYVRKSERGTGLAARLLGKITQYANELGVSQIELTVSAENSAAVQFYLKQGFSQVGYIPAGLRHEGRDIDELLMLLRVQGSS